MLLTSLKNIQLVMKIFSYVIFLFLSFFFSTYEILGFCCLSPQVTVQLSHLINALHSLKGSVSHKHRENIPEHDLNCTEVVTFICTLINTLNV